MHTPPKMIENGEKKWALYMEDYGIFVNIAVIVLKIWNEGELFL